MDIKAVYSAISAAVNGQALQGNTLQVTATDFLPLSFTFPHFYPFNFRITYDRTFGGVAGTPSGMNEMTATWHLALSYADAEGAFHEALNMAGSGEGTIRDAILSTRGGPGEDALGGAAEDVRLTSASGPNLVDIGDSTHLLVLEFPLVIIGR